MKIKKLTAKNFTVFRDKLELNFCPGINVFIGENGTGKSHALKLIYSMLKAHETRGTSAAPKSLQFEGTLASKLAGVFKPDDLALNRLISRVQGTTTAEVAIETDSGDASFKVASKGGVIRSVKDTLAAGERSIFLPSREVLSLYEGFRSLYRERLISMDETYADLCDSLGLPQLKGPRGKTAAKFIQPFEKLIGGTVRLKDERFYVIFDGGAQVEAHLVAEGWRKLGSIAHLVMNGALRKNGVLFWDEPEANLNPKAISVVVNMLCQLAAEGIQIFLSTHDYVLSTLLSFQAEYRNGNSSGTGAVSHRFISLKRDESGGIKAEHGDNLAELSNNPILEEFSLMYQRESEMIGRAMAGGKK